MLIFLDANVLFSAAHSKSRLNEFIWLLGRNHDLVSSDYAEKEALRNVSAKRPNWSAELQRLLMVVQIVPSIDRELCVEINTKDRPILATAIQVKCDYLITGDRRDFGHLFGQAVEGVRVLTPLMLAEELPG